MVTVKITIVEVGDECTSKITLVKKNSTDTEYELARVIFNLVATALTITKQGQESDLSPTDKERE